ncbi:hypothetical protein H6504_01835 [Candidatus Woesearchaeota archaeon]|nr:hypothetical protein [Candidatus Woesearchaeota archaeon]
MKKLLALAGVAFVVLLLLTAWVSAGNGLQVGATQERDRGTEPLGDRTQDDGCNPEPTDNVVHKLRDCI